MKLYELEALKAEIEKGVADVAARRVRDFDAIRIIKRGRKQLAARSNPK
jgi:antitoxin ParD1/3/4